MAAPQPKPPGKERDTFFPKGGAAPDRCARRSISRDLDGNLLGHFDVGQIPPGDEGRMVAGGLKGVFLKWLIDENFGARHHRLLFIEYLPGVGIGAARPHLRRGVLHSERRSRGHDGRQAVPRHARATCSGPASAACTRSPTWAREPVRWLETFSPQPPAENVFRFMADWEQRARELEGQAS